MARAGEHPFLDGLFEVLPPPGALWSTEKQEEWLTAARNIFGLIYATDVHPKRRPAGDGPGEG